MLNTEGGKKTLLISPRLISHLLRRFRESCPGKLDPLRIAPSFEQLQFKCINYEKIFQKVSRTGKGREEEEEGEGVGVGKLDTLSVPLSSKPFHGLLSIEPESFAEESD